MKATKQQIKYYINRNEILHILETQKIHARCWKVSFDEAYTLFLKQDENIEYNKFVTLLESCYTSKMHGNANKGLRYIREWAKQTKKRQTY